MFQRNGKKALHPQNKVFVLSSQIQFCDKNIEKQFAITFERRRIRQNEFLHNNQQHFIQTLSVQQVLFAFFCLIQAAFET